MDKADIMCRFGSGECTEKCKYYFSCSRNPHIKKDVSEVNKMYCKCGEKAAVIEVRHTTGVTYRKNKCKACGNVFYTMEKGIRETGDFLEKWKSLYRRTDAEKTKPKIKMNCFAYSEGECTVLDELVCRTKECSFYKPTGTECDSCHNKKTVNCRYCVNNASCKA